MVAPPHTPRRRRAAAAPPPRARPRRLPAAHAGGRGGDGGPPVPPGGPGGGTADLWAWYQANQGRPYSDDPAFMGCYLSHQGSGPVGPERGPHPDAREPSCGAGGRHPVQSRGVPAQGELQVREYVLGRA